MRRVSNLPPIGIWIILVAYLFHHVTYHIPSFSLFPVDLGFKGILTMRWCSLTLRNSSNTVVYHICDPSTCNFDHGQPPMVLMKCFNIILCFKRVLITSSNKEICLSMFAGDSHPFFFTFIFYMTDQWYFARGGPSILWSRQK